MPTSQPLEAPLVLVVDDNEDNREIAVQALLHSGLRVDTASDGAEGLRKTVELHPAAVVMDLCMPNMDGWKATAAIKRAPELADICVIVVTAHALTDDHSRAVQAGCDRFLVKPVDPTVLVSEVRSAIQKRDATPRSRRPKRPEFR